MFITQFMTMRYSLNSNSRYYRERVEQIRFSEIIKLSRESILFIRYPKFDFFIFDIILLFLIYLLRCFNGVKPIYIQHNEIQYRYKYFRKIGSYFFTLVAHHISESIYTISPHHSLANSTKFRGAIYNSPIPFKRGLENPSSFILEVRLIFISTLPLRRDIIKAFEASESRYSLISNKLELLSVRKNEFDWIKAPLYLGGCLDLSQKKNIVFIPHSNGSHPTLFYHALYYNLPMIIFCEEYDEFYDEIIDCGAGVRLTVASGLDAAMDHILRNYDLFQKNVESMKININSVSIKI